MDSSSPQRRPQDRRQPRPPQRQAPGPLLAVMGATAIIFIILAVATGEWVFLALGIIGMLAGLVPILDRRN